MRYLNNLDLLFYAGVVVILAFYIIIVYYRFGEDDYIDLKEHWGFIVIDIILLVLTIVVWRYVFDIVLSEKIIKLLTTDIYGVEI